MAAKKTAPREAKARAKSPAKALTKKPAKGPRERPKQARGERGATISASGRVVLPRWFKAPVEALVGSHVSLDVTEQGPHGLAFTMSQAFGDLVAERLGDSAIDAITAAIGSPSHESSSFVKRLARALERGFEPHDEGGLRDDIDEAWLVKTFLSALGIGFSARKTIAMRVLTRPLFEKAVADAMAQARGTSLGPRAMALRVIEAALAVAKQCGFGEVTARLEELRRRDPRLEIVLAPRIEGLRVSSAPPAQWRELGFPDVAARVKDERDHVAVSSPIWVARERDAGAALDRLAEIADLAWEAQAPAEEAQQDEARLIEAGLVKPYRIDATFAKGDTLNHPTFGLGVVMVATRETIEVAFPGGARKLAHGR